MVRVLRYPRLSALCCAGAFLTAAARDFCLGLELWGPANVLLTAALILLIAGLVLLSCRFLVDPTGVGVGFLLRVRRTAWEDLSAFGPLCCNSRRLYLYGLYKHHPDFLHMLHKAPRCGNWGFVVPVSRKLAAAVSACCPFEIDLYTGMQRRREKGLRPVWQQAAVTALTSCAAAVAALFTAIPLLLRASTMPSYPASVPPTLLAALLICHFLNAVLHKRGVYTLGEKAERIYLHNTKLKRHIALILAAVVVATGIAHALSTELWGPGSIVEGTTFHDYESFVEYMEQDVPSEMDAYWGEVSSVPDHDVTNYDEFGNEITWEEAHRQTLEDPDGNVLCEYIDRNESVISIQYSFSKKDGDALPITVYTYEDRNEAKDKAAVRHVIFGFVYAIEVAAIMAVYFRKRRKC